VVTLSDANIVGEVRDVLFNPSDQQVTGFTLRGRGLFSSPLIGLLPADGIRAVGSDAVMIPSEDVILRERSQFESQLADRQEAPGTAVVTEDGLELGLVSDIVLEIGEGQPTVVGYCVERDTGREWVVPTPASPHDWGEEIVVPAGIEKQASEGLAGFSAALQRRREAEGIG
jgi:uncharacterized protein YrrD